MSDVDDGDGDYYVSDVDDGDGVESVNSDTNSFSGTSAVQSTTDIQKFEWSLQSNESNA